MNRLTTQRPVALAFWGSWKYERAHLTVGDILSVEAIRRGLLSRGVPAAVFFEGDDYPGRATDTIDPRSFDPRDASAFAFVCGPLHAYGPARAFFESFAQVPRFALNVSQVTESYGGEASFDDIVWRDSSDTRTFDTAIDPRSSRPAGSHEHRNGIGICTVGDQPEYGSAGRNSNIARRLIDEAVGGENGFDISTVLGSRSPAEVERQLCRSRVVVTTRLHASLIAIRNRIPVVAIDQVTGGAKVRRIVGEELGWPYTFDVTELDSGRLVENIRRAAETSEEQLRWFQYRAEALAAAATDFMCDRVLEHLTRAAP
jgi:hypothetical protein